MSFKRVLTTYTLYFGLVLLIAGIILMIFGVLGVFYSGSKFLVGNVQEVLDYIGAWSSWCLMLGIGLILIGGWYFYDNIKKRKEFTELMEITSKKKFLKNMDRVEYLAWKLTPWHRIEVSKKKKKFNIK